VTEVDEGVEDSRSDGVRRGLLARTIYEILATANRPLRALEVMTHVAERIDVNERELSTNRSGQVRWRTAANAALSWSTFGGWLERDEDGRYSLTESGAEALAELSGDDLWLEISRRYRASKGDSPLQGSGWDPFLRWARELANVVDLDLEERDYKLKAAEKWAAAGAACASSAGDWPALLRRAAGAANLIDPFAQIWLRNRIEDRTDEVRAAFGELHADGTTPAIDAFRASLKSWGEYISPGDVTAFAATTLMGRDAAEHPPYRASFAQDWAKIVGADPGDSPRERYERLLTQCDELISHWQATDGVPGLRDRLDAQGLAWVALRWAPPYRWEPLRRAELRAWRAGSTGPVSVDRGEGVRPSMEAAVWQVLGAGLRGEESTLVPGHQTWTPANAHELGSRLDGGTPGNDFLTRLIEQLVGAPDEVLGLAAELLHVRDAPLFDMTATKKVARIQSVLDLMSTKAKVPDFVVDGVAGAGSFRGGQGYHSRAAQHLQWLCRFVEHWLTQPEQAREEALQDPMAFRAVAVRTAHDSPAIRYVVEYLAWPGIFPSVVSEAHRRQIRDGLIGDFGSPSGTDNEAITRDLVALRALHEDKTRQYPDWYGAPYVSRWRKNVAPAPRAWLVRPGEGGSVLVDAWRGDGFVSLKAEMLTGVEAGASETAVLDAVRAGYQHLDRSQQDELATAYHRFLSALAEDDLVLTVDENALRIGVVTGAAELGEQPGSRLRLPVEWSDAMAPVPDLDEPLPTLLVQQGQVVDLTAAYDVVTALLPEDDVDTPEMKPAPMETIPRLPPVTEELAQGLFMPRKDLQEIVDLLQSRQQLVFYGPPGTGKTYVAKELAKHLVGSDDQSRVRLVQFHPSYSYEDFFEGYRPTHDGSFELTDGPLRLLAAEAGLAENRVRAYILIVDEMNRANLAKVFGELYFLLEYRRETVRPQYQPSKPFRLPLNLFVIGTMNTADRSIALVDAAIRRRFPFYEMHPGKPPVSGVLEGFMSAPGRPPADDRVALLREFNAAVGVKGRDLHIGPSYLMRPEVDQPGGLERVWRYDILPLLHEHFYGQKSPEDIDREFGLDALRKRLVTESTPQSAAPATQASAEPEADDHP
jgi:5-methylcytosine-specific restriction protein B